jgi:hypothetical protein
LDKQNKKNTKISIKINGEKTDKQDDLLVHNWKLGEKETAAAEEKLDEDSFEWVLPEEQVSTPKEYKKINYVQDKKSKNRKIKNPFKGSSSIIMSLIGAIVVGVVLGFGTLKVITNTDGPSTPAASLQDESASTKGKDVKTAAVELKGLSIPVIQGGVFSTEESLEATRKSVEGKGIPTAKVEKDGQFYLVVAASGELETANLVSDQYKDKIDVYAKEFVLGGKTVQVTEGEKEFLEKGNEVYSLLAQESSNGLVMGTTNEAVMNTIKEKLKAIEGMKVEQKSIQEMKNNLINAGNALIGLKSSDDALEAQKQVLSYLEIYGSLK